MFHFKSLTAKVSTFIVAIMIVVILVLSGVFIISEQNKLAADSVKDGQIFANFSTLAIYQNFVQFYSHPDASDFANFKTNIQTLLNNDTDVVDVSLLSANGTILFDSGEFTTGKYEGPTREVTDSQTLSMLANDSLSSAAVADNGQNLTEIIVPVADGGAHLFSVEYLLSTQSFTARMHEVYVQILSVVLPMLLLIILIAIAFSITLTKPIRLLTLAVEKLHGGNFDEIVAVTSRDEIGRLATSFNDMTAQLKKSYANLTDEKARLLSSINSLSFGFMMFGVNDVLILSNPSIAIILGKNPLPQSIPELISCFQEYDISTAYARCLKFQQVAEIKEVPFGKKILRIFFIPIFNGQIIIGHVALFEDITEAKVIERSKEEFFAVASHELRTPLTAIRGSAEMLLTASDKLSDADKKEMLADIDDGSMRLINMVNDFLQISRLEQGRIDSKKESFDISALLQRIVHEMKVIAEKKGVSLAAVVPEHVSFALADQNYTEQIITNLLGNAIKFTDHGTITLALSEDAGLLKVSVSDNGIGISETNQALLFRKFQQAGENILARDASQGTGLGLYICKLLVTNMGGDIWLEKSELGTGSTFAFTVPKVV